MIEEYAEFTDKASDGNEERACVTVTRYDLHPGEKGKPQLTLAIHGPDQEATEFLTQRQFERLVTNARRIMGWKTP